MDENERWKKLDTFGRFLVDKLRDGVIDKAERLVYGNLTSDHLDSLKDELSKLTEEQQAIAIRLVVESTSAAIHDFLHGLVAEFDFAEGKESGIEARVEGINVVELDHSLHFIGFDWIERLSKYPGEKFPPVSPRTGGRYR